MTDPRSPPLPVPATGRAGQPAGPPPKPAADTAPRPQPPLKEVLKGLDTRELEGPTVFDQLFGPPTSP